MLSNIRKAFTPHRFFSTLGQLSCPVSLKEASLRSMLASYPYLMQGKFHGQIAYCLRGETPEELSKAGALYPWAKKLWLANTGSGDNTGSVCFSLLPEVPTLFYPSTLSKSKAKEAYLYAFPLYGDFIFPGGRWRQVISPGAFPLPSVWRARQMLGVTPDKEVPGRDRVLLGPLKGSGDFECPSACPRFLAYLNITESLLVKPQELPGSDDFPQEFDIIDTELTERFQNEVEAHYRSVNKTNLKWGS